MKPIIAMTVFLLFSSSLILTANAGTVTTTTVTTVKTVKKTNCHKKYKSYKKRYYSRGCSSYYGCSYYDEAYYSRCPGGAWDCYYDLHGRHFQQEDISRGVSYGHDVRYSCLASEDPGSCS